MKTIVAAFCAASLLLADPALAADPAGNWQTENGRSRVRITACGAAVCGTVSWLQEPNDPKTGKPKTDQNNADAGKRNRPIIGVPIILNMKPSGADKWAGQIYNAEDGKTYSATLTYAGGSTLKVEGCAMGGMFCRAQTWTKVN